MTELRIPQSYPMMLIAPTGVWALTFPIEGRILASTLVVGYCRIPSENDAMNPEDLNNLLKSKTNFELQIQHNFDHLDTPVLSVEVGQINFSGTGIEVTFNILELSEAYDDLISELTSA